MNAFTEQTVTTSASSRVGQFDYDPEAKAGYLCVRDDPRSPIVTRTLITDRVFVDYDCLGRVVGVEFLDIESPEIVSVT